MCVLHTIYDPEGQPHLPGRPAAPRPGTLQGPPVVLRAHRGPGLDGRPAFYFEIAPDYYSYGMGFWAASAATMTRYRQQIDRDPKTLEKLVRQFDRQQVFQLTGPDYVRSKGQVSDLLRPWYQKKSLTLAHEVPLDESLYSPAFAARVTEDLKTLLPFYRYFAALCAAAE